MDEVDFVNAAQGAVDNTMIHMRLGSVPLFIMPYLGALKAWIYAPVFRVFGVSALTIRLPAILLAAVSLLIFYRMMRARVGILWATIAIWIMAVDPANLFPSRLDWGPTVLMHLFQAAILAIWLSYRDRPERWKIILIFVCFALGFFDKFNFIWLVLAFVIAACLCYPGSLKRLWASLKGFAHWIAIILVLIALGATLYLILPLLLHFRPAPAHAMGLLVNWNGLLITLSGVAVAGFIFGNPSGIFSFTTFWLIVTDCYLALACLLFPMSNAQARENRKSGLFFLLIGFLIFLQIAVTPQAGGPHHYSMIFPLPLLTFVFLAASLYSELAAKNRRRFAAFLFGSAAMCIFVVNIHNTAIYLAHFRTNPHYNARWSPEIYSVSHYVNEHGLEAQRIICVDWGLHNELHALAPKKIRRRMQDRWNIFRQLGTKSETDKSATLRVIFPEGTHFVLMFAASEETFPETRRNFLDSLRTHPELKSRLSKEFWFGGEKIYELYEVVREPDGA
jgi:Dolichyl-phosphate-mannose-protein mannosyltransferase